MIESLNDRRLLQPLKSMCMLGDITATLKGNSGTYLLAVWSKDSFSYSLSISSGAAEETWGGIIAKAV